MWGGGFSNANHLMALGEDSSDEKKNRDDANNTTLKGLVRDLQSTYQPLILRAKNIGACLSVCGTTVSVTVFWPRNFGISYAQVTMLPP